MINDTNEGMSRNFLGQALGCFVVSDDQCSQSSQCYERCDIDHTIRLTRYMERGSIVWNIGKCMHDGNGIPRTQAGVRCQVITPQQNASLLRSTKQVNEDGRSICPTRRHVYITGYE